MNQLTANWILIGLALVAANLPFLLERPLLVLPWTKSGGKQRPAALTWLLFLVFFALAYGLIEAARILIGQAVFAGGGPLQALLFLLRIVGLCAAAWLLMAFPGWWKGTEPATKSFFERLLEVLTLYVLIGALGFAFEAYLGSVFPQSWEFYAITLSLFLVMGYPGFVYRYMLRKHKKRKASV